jgi:hypothetical protein
MLTFISPVFVGLKWTRIILKLKEERMFSGDSLEQKPYVEVIPT